METSRAVVVPGRRLGKLAPRFDRRTLRLARFVDLDTIAKPPKVHIISQHVITREPPGFKWGAMKNDQLGDCTCAAIGHARQVWTSYGSGTPHTPSDDQVVALYNLVNGGADNGANMIDVLNKMLKAETALEGNTVLGFVGVSAANEKMIRIAHYLFGGVYVGVGLPVNAQHQKVWDSVNENGDEKSGWGGHAMWMVDINKIGPVYVTWGELQQATWAWHFRYSDECFGVLDDDYINKGGRAPSGFRLKALKNAIEKLKAA